MLLSIQFKNVKNKSIEYQLKQLNEKCEEKEKELKTKNEIVAKYEQELQRLKTAKKDSLSSFEVQTKNTLRISQQQIILVEKKEAKKDQQEPKRRKLDFVNAENENVSLSTQRNVECEILSRNTENCNESNNELSYVSKNKKQMNRIFTLENSKPFQAPFSN